MVSEGETEREVGHNATLVHMTRFFDSVRTRKPPVEDARMGHHAAACAHMVNQSIRTRAAVEWDFARDILRKA